VGAPAGTPGKASRVKPDVSNLRVFVGAQAVVQDAEGGAEDGSHIAEHHDGVPQRVAPATRFWSKGRL
jgi:hypothetical protein